MKSKKQSENVLSTIYETAMDGFWMIDLKGQIVDANKAYCQMSGYSHEELVSMHVVDIEVIENENDIQNRIQNLIRNGEDRFETKHRAKSGKIFEVEISAKSLSGKDSFIILFIRDITESKRNKNALLEADWKFKALFELGPIGVAYHKMIYDEAGEPYDYYCIDENKSCIELTGVETKGKTIREAYPGIENDPADWIGKFGHVAKTGENIRFEQYLEANGRWYDVVGYQFKPDHFVAAFTEITQRKVAEIELIKSKERVEESETQYKNLANSGLALIWTSGTDKLCNYFNEPWLKFTGRTLDQEMGNGWAEGVHPDDFDRCLSTYLTAFDKHEAFEMEYRLRHVSGEYRWILDMGTPNFNSYNEFIGYIGNCFDINASKQSGEELKKAKERAELSELRFKILFDDAPDAMLLADPETREVVDANNAAEFLFKKQKQELIGLFQHELHPQQNIEISKSTFKTHFEKNKKYDKILPVENSILCSDGTEIPVEILGQSIRIGEKALMLGTFRDITERKHAEEKEKELLNRLELLSLHLPGVIYQYRLRSDGTSHFPYASPGIFNIYGVMPEEVEHDASSAFKAIFHEDLEKVSASIYYSAEKLIPWHYIYRVNQPSGRTIWVEGNSTPQKMEDGSIIWHGFIQDITERKHAMDLFKDIIDKNPMSIQIVDKEGYTLQTNPAFGKLFGTIPPSDYSIFKDLISKGPELEALIQRTINGDVVHLPDIFYNVHDLLPEAPNNPLWIRALIFPLKDSNGKPERFVIMHENISERKKAEIALKESEEELRNLIELSPVAMCIVHEWKTIYFNPAALQLFGAKSLSEVVNRNIIDFVHPDGYTILYENAELLTKKGYVPKHEQKYLKLDGTILDVEPQAKSIRFNNEKATLVVINDITESKKAELALRESEEKYRLFTDNSGLGVGVYSPDGKVILYNQQALKNMGGVAEDFVGKSLFDIFDNKSATMYFNRIQNALLQDFSTEYEDFVPLKTGEHWYLSNFTRIKNDKNEIIAVQIISKDISDRKRAEKALSISEKRYRSLLQFLETGIVVHTSNSSIIMSNPKASELLGLTNDQMQGKVAIDPDWKFVNIDNTPMLLHDYPVQRIIISKNAIKDQILGIQHTAKREIVWVNVNGFPVMNDEGEITEIIISFIDISERLQATETIKAKNKELENLIYVASHDLRSPLVNIQGFSQRLEKHTLDILNLVQQYELENEIKTAIDKITNDEIPKSLGYIMSNITKMDSLINGLLKLSRTGRILMTISEIDMNSLFQSIINTHQFELSELHAQVEIDSLSNCYGDENQLNQLFSNIIANAIKYRDKNRQLTLKIQSTTHLNTVVYAVSDNGIGINNNHLQKIWDIFYRVNPTKSETGEGLGLSVARKITEKHKGKIWVESEPGIGSTFYIELLQTKFDE